MLILVGCEESQEVCKAFRAKGHEAYSCDLLPCSGGFPEWHIQGDVLEAVKGGVLMLQTGDLIKVKKWDAGIFFPTCTFLCSSGLHWNTRVEGRKEKTEKALEFVRDLLNCGIERIALENPVGCIATRIYWYSGSESEKAYWEVSPENIKGAIKPAQIIQPYQFGDDASKATCLYLINFPMLTHTHYVQPRIVKSKTGKNMQRWSNQTDSGQNRLAPSETRAQQRSKTYPGIAAAMADQWG